MPPGLSELHAFWSALFAGHIVRPDTLAEMTRPRVYVEDEDLRYGAGFWLHREHSAVIAEGYDAGVSFRSTHIPERHTTASVLGNTSEGAWPVVGVVAAALS